MSTENLSNLAASLAAFLLLAAPVAASTATEAARTVGTDESAMPAMLRLALARSQSADVAAAYHLDRDGRGANPRHGLELAFTPQGARIDGPTGGFSLRLERFGRGDGRPVRRAAPRIDGTWVEYDRGAGLTEWFVNLPRGVEQGWTVARRPAGDGALVLELDTTRPPDERYDRGLVWSELIYHRLVAFDAAGRVLPAAWSQDGARLRIEVDDHEAAYPVVVDPWVEQAKLTADDGAESDLFGIAVALDGDSALVGAWNADSDGIPFPGVAYVFARSDGVWSQQAKLTADDGATGDGFGGAVALEGDTALVGSSGADPGGNLFQGAAYVFTRNGGVWSQQAKLTADDSAEFDNFGQSVALAGDTALVGALFADGGSSKDAGAAYIFTRSNGVWSQQAKLTADDGEESDEFGYAVDVDGDSALVGAWAASPDNNFIEGAAYVFTRSGGAWSQQAKLEADDGAAGDWLGTSVALDGDTALVGAPQGGSIITPASPGAAYVFTRSGGAWSQQAKLTADDGVVDDWFGVSVALVGDTALVGASQADLKGSSNQGAAYVFSRIGAVWTQQVKLTADDGETSDRFGESVALAGDTALLGAASAAVDGNASQGAAYVFVPPVAAIALAVDPELMTSADGNGIFEPGEMVDVGPTWRNKSTAALDLMGTASGFTGPPGATYTLAQDGADYGTLDPGQSASCLDTGICYVMGLDDPAARPATHWDATFDETLVGTARTWTLHIGDSFTDVPRGSLFYSWIEALLHSGVTGGCDDADYCPAGTSTRGQMPAFVLRALLGPEFTPEPCVAGQERFADVPADHLFCPWIEELAERDVVTGCGDGNYCPNSPATRAQMAIFLLRALEGPDFTPPECSGVFADVDCPSIFADWVEELFNRGVTGGCGEAPLRYCPSATNTRGQMAVFLSKTFGLTLYGP